MGKKDRIYGVLPVTYKLNHKRITLERLQGH